VIFWSKEDFRAQMKFTNLCFWNMNNVSPPILKVKHENRRVTCFIYQLARSLPVQETYDCFGKRLIVSTRRYRDDSEGNHCKSNRVTEEETKCAFSYPEYDYVERRSL